MAKLTDEQKKYIVENREMDPKEISKNMKGVGPSTVEAYLEGFDDAPRKKELPPGEKGESYEEKQERIARLALSSGDFFATHSNDSSVPKGVVVSTKVASELAEAKECKDRDCPFHGKLRVHGRTYKGTVTKKFPKRIVIEFERTLYIKKYERYAKAKTKLHARLPDCIEEEINVGDLVLVKECRPLSKIIHF